MSVNLLKKERKDLILKEINVHTRVTFAELVDVLNVSEDTIRRDLNELAEEGRLLKLEEGQCQKPIIILLK
jgi:DeoR/GlpR family transcriptional regulator of sugar metabolism